MDSQCVKCYKLVKRCPCCCDDIHLTEWMCDQCKQKEQGLPDKVFLVHETVVYEVRAKSPESACMMVTNCPERNKWVVECTEREAQLIDRRRAVFNDDEWRKL